MKVILQDVCSPKTSNLAQKDLIGRDGDYPVYGASGYIGNINFYHQANKCVAVVKDGAGIGRTMLLPEKSTAIGTMQYLIPKENILPEYLFYAVKNMHLEKYYTGATIPHIYFKDYKNEKFNYVDLEQQLFIVNTLKLVEGIISKKTKQLEQLDNLVKSLFVEMFGDTVINPLGWEEHKLEEYIDFLTSGSRGWAKYFVNEENELFLTIKNVKNNKIVLDDIQYIKAPKNKEAERTKVKCGDLLISITADLGRTGVIDKDISSRGAYINQHLSLVRLDQNRINPQYISYYLETDAGKRQFCSKNQNGVKAGLNFDAIKSLNIIVPPIELQDDFVKNIYFIDKHKLLIID